MKDINEITVKIKCEIKEIYKILEEKKFESKEQFYMEDIYFIPKQLELKTISTREILSKAILVRKITRTETKNVTKQITFKIKEINEHGDILKQQAINCDINDIEQAKRLLKAVGYIEIMTINEEDIVYKNEEIELAVKNILNGDNLIEVEENEKFNTVEKLMKKLDEIEIPIYKDNYFVKKAEIELDKILNRNIELEKACGCIIIEDDKVLLVKQTQGHWGFPKGHIEENETEIETAIREVKEETNMDVEIIDSNRYTMQYTTDKDNLKEVVLYIARNIGGKIKAQECEINEIKWLGFKEALEVISYENTKDLFKKVIKERNL